MALSSSSSSSADGGGEEEESALEAWAGGHEHLRLDMLTNETTHRRMVEVGGCFWWFLGWLVLRAVVGHGSHGVGGWWVCSLGHVAIAPIRTALTAPHLKTTKRNEHQQNIYRPSTASPPTTTGPPSGWSTSPSVGSPPAASGPPTSQPRYVYICFIHIYDVICVCVYVRSAWSTSASAPRT